MENHRRHRPAQGSASQGVPEVHPARHRDQAARPAPGRVQPQGAGRRDRPLRRSAVRLHRHAEPLRPLSHPHAGPRRAGRPSPARGAADFLDARGHGPRRAGAGPRGAREGILQHLPEQARLLVHAHAFQFRHAPAAALELLPALLRRLDGRNRRDVDPLLHALEMGGRPRLLVDGGARQRRPHPRHQRRIVRRHSVPEGRQRHLRRGQPGRQAPRRAVQLCRALARGHRGLPRPAQGDRRRPAPHPQHEHGPLDSRPVHEAPARYFRGPPAQGRDLDALPHQRNARPARALRPGVRGALSRVRGARRGRQGLRARKSACSRSGKR